MNGKELKTFQQINKIKDLETLINFLGYQCSNSNVSKEDVGTVWNAYNYLSDHLVEKEKQLFWVNVAKILAKYNIDLSTISSVFLFGALKLNLLTLEQIQKDFSKEIFQLIEGTRLLDNYSFALNNSEKLQNLLLTIINDVRTVLIQLAVRLETMRTIESYDEKQKINLAKETLSVFAPLAERLGMSDLKSELEDLSFKQTNPNEYFKIAHEIESIQKQNEEILTKAKKQLQENLPDYNLSSKDFEFTWRSKHIYSIYKKMHTQKYIEKGIERIYDKLGMRIITKTEQECYTILSIIHSLWEPIPGEYDNYIRNPRTSGYRSLHIAVRYSDKKHHIIEFQIRTKDMHYEAEHGVAAHWLYKEADLKDKVLKNKIGFLRKIIEGIKQGEDVQELINESQEEYEEQRIYVITPKGDVKDIPVGSTPIDFAYSIHTEVGHRCRGAIVNGNIVSLNYKLSSGDEIKILTSNKSSPKRDWLNPNLELTFRSSTRSKIRRWFRKQERKQNIIQGRILVEKELKRLGFSHTFTTQDIAKALKYTDIDEFFAKLGFGDILSAQISGAISLLQKTNPDQNPLEKLKQDKQTEPGLQVGGKSNLFIRIAKCCNPIPPDPIIGFTTRGYGVTIHHINCKQLQSIPERERLIEANWGNGNRFNIPIEIIGIDRAGLMADIANILKIERVNLTDIKTKIEDDGFANFYLEIQVADLNQLSQLLNKIDNLTNVLEVRRSA